MRIADKTDHKLILVDDQSDKRLSVKIVAVLAGVFALYLAWEGFPEGMFVWVALFAGMLLYLRRSAMTSSMVFDRVKDQVKLTVADREGTKTWEWALSDIAGAEINTRGQSGSDSGIDRPELILKDGTRAPMRPYHSAGSQSWHMVAAVTLFLDQPLKSAPVEWIPPEEFDTFFADEMARLYNKG